MHFLYIVGLAQILITYTKYRTDFSTKMKKQINAVSVLYYGMDIDY